MESVVGIKEDADGEDYASPERKKEPRSCLHDNSFLRKCITEKEKKSKADSFIETMPELKLKT